MCTSQRVVTEEVMAVARINGTEKKRNKRSFKVEGALDIDSDVWLKTKRGNKVGAPRRTRSTDLVLTKHTLYQQSYWS